MKLIVIPCQTSLYTDIKKAKSLRATFDTAETEAFRKVFQNEGWVVDVVYNDVGYTDEILKRDYDTVLLKVPGFVFYGGVLDKRTSNFLRFISERDLNIWVVYNDCSYAFTTGCETLRRSLPKLKFADPTFTSAEALKGLETLERMYSKGITVVCPGGRLDFKLSKDSENLKWEMISKPEINRNIASLFFSEIPELEQPEYDVCYAGVWRKDREIFLKNVLDDGKFQSVSTCSGLKGAKKEIHLDLNLANHREIEGFKFTEQQIWYQKSLTQLVVSDPGTYGKFVSPRWFSALRTNAVPLIQADYDFRRELLSEAPDLSFLYVENSDEVSAAVEILSEPGARKEVLGILRNLEEPWFSSLR